MFGFGSVQQPPDPDRELRAGQEVHVGNITFTVLHVPGHCPGHVAFYDEENGILFSGTLREGLNPPCTKKKSSPCPGDVLFRGAIGRTDLPLSDSIAMQATLTVSVC